MVMAEHTPALKRPMTQMETPFLSQLGLMRGAQRQQIHMTQEGI